MNVTMEEIHRRWQQAQRPLFTKKYLTYLLRSGGPRLFWEYDRCLRMPKSSEQFPVQVIHFYIFLN
jgi:hypothetical protein